MKWNNWQQTVPKKYKCSRTVMLSNKISCWGHRPRLALTSLRLLLISNPFTLAVPLDGAMNPANNSINLTHFRASRSNILCSGNTNVIWQSLRGQSHTDLSQVLWSTTSKDILPLITENHENDHSRNCGSRLHHNHWISSLLKTTTGE